MTNREKMALLDAKEAVLRLLKDRRTAGRFGLYLAIAALVEQAIPMPSYETRRQLREATLAVGR